MKLVVKASLEGDGDYPFCCSDSQRRFFTKTKKVGNCLLWMGAKSSRSYGTFAMHLRCNKWSAHRLAYTYYYGDVPEGLFVCHSCDVKSCIKAEHLFVGTPQQNLDDMIAKGRSMTGVKNHKAKLTEDDVREIRKLRASGVKFQALADAYGLSLSTVDSLVKGKTWKSIS